jgi:hypothetical protein
MAWTISEAIGAVREILKDEVPEAYRYSDASLMRAFNIAITELHTLRPDAFIVKEPWTYLTTDDMDKEFPVPLNFFNPVIYFICGYAELRDEEYSQDNRAGILLTKFTQDVTGGQRG